MIFQQAFEHGGQIGVRFEVAVLRIAGAPDALRRSTLPRKYHLGEIGAVMAVVFDTIAAGRLRHPEKAHRPDQPALRKPDWIRVKAPVSPGYLDTQNIVSQNGLHTVCEKAGC